MNKKYCEHCYPAEPQHFSEKLNSLMSVVIVSPMFGFVSSMVPDRVYVRLERSLIKAMNLVMNKMGLVRFVDEIDRSQFCNRVLVMWDEAKKRDYQIYNIKTGKRHTNNFFIIKNNRKMFFEENPITLKPMRNGGSMIQSGDYDHKLVFKKLLEKHDFPAPKGKVFSRLKQAIRFSEQVGFPLVVKPADMSLSRHVFTKIKTPSELAEAFAKVKQTSWQVMVEQEIKGEVYRVVVLDDRMIACARRMPAVVIGDNKKTIKELLTERNRHPWRGPAQKKDCTLHVIEENKRLEDLLEQQQVSQLTILPEGRQVFLAHKVNTGNGADIYNVTDEVCRENVKLFEAMHQKTGLLFGGYDFICEDVSLPWQDQSFAFIEANTLPYIDMHHFPLHGEPIDVAGMIWDKVNELLEK